VLTKQGEDEMTAKENEELQRQALYVQLKILKELRILNKNLSAINNTLPLIGQSELSDVKEALALTGFNFI
jgi:hypothetical protein